MAADRHQHRPIYGRSTRTITSILRHVLHLGVNRRVREHTLANLLHLVNAAYVAHVSAFIDSNALPTQGPGTARGEAAAEHPTWVPWLQAVFNGCQHSLQLELSEQPH